MGAAPHGISILLTLVICFGTLILIVMVRYPHTWFLLVLLLVSPPMMLFAWCSPLTTGCTTSGRWCTVRPAFC